MARPDRCIVPVLVAAVLAVPSGSLGAQEKKAPPKSQSTQSKPRPKAQPKKNAIVLDLVRVLQADRLRNEKLELVLKAQHPLAQEVRAKLLAQNKAMQAQLLVAAKDQVRLRVLGLPGRRLNAWNLVLHPARVNPIMKGDYLAALGELQKKRAQLDGIRNPKDARRVVDEMQRILLDVRRALWEMEQAEKKKAGATKATADKKNK